jgi:hypothetical protein
MSAIRERTDSVSFEQVLETSKVYQRRRPSFVLNDRKSISFMESGLGDDKISGVAVSISFRVTGEVDHWFDAVSKLEPEGPQPQELEPQGTEPQGSAKTGSPLATPGNDLPELRGQVIVSTP